MRITSSTHFPDIPVAVTKFRTITRFMSCVRNPDGTYLLYGSQTSNHDALLEALDAHPMAVHVQDVEYLPPEAIQALREAVAQDPITSALRHLGRIDPKA